MEALEPQAIGRYELLLELGRGGMAVLYLARAQGVGGFSKLFAIKQILPHLAVDPPFVEMFLNEGRIAARLSHPNLCPVFELGQDRGELFLVMEYLDGVPWDAVAAAAPHDARGLALAAGVLAQACEGLHHAHTFRDVDGTPTPIVHRDVSPQNVFVSADGVCRVLDFGVSKIASDRRRTGTGLLKGKLPYMAPELLHGERADPRADVWAVGVMLWEALTGERLFDRATDFLTYQAIIGAPIPSVNATAPGGPRYPAAIDHVIARALGRDRDTRIPTARELGRDLQRVAAEVGGAATREQIADAINALCGEQLAARRRAIAAAVARRSTPPPGAPMAAGFAAPPPPAGTAHDTAGHPGEAAETISMMMRRDAIVVERPRRRRWRAGALGLAAAAVLVAGIAAWRAAGDGSAPAAGSARRASPDDPAAMRAAGGGPPGNGSIGATTADSSNRGESLPTVSPATLPSDPARGPGAAIAITSPAPAVAGNPPRRKRSAATGHPASAESGHAPGGREPSATGRTASAESGHAPEPDEPAVTGKRGAAATKKSAAVRVPEEPGRRVLDDHGSPSGPSGPPGGLAVPVASHGAPAPGSAASDASGWYAIDSNPYATIFIDDRKIGDTPLDRIPLAPGGHRVRAVLADGRQRSFAIDIAPDRKTSSGTLAW